VLAQELLRLCEETGADGVDFNNEAEFDVKEYAKLLGAVKSAFTPKGKVVTASIHYWTDLSAAGFSALDFVHLMAYDIMGQKPSRGHSTLDDSKQVVQMLISKKGVEKGKILMGIPSYARSVDNPGEVRTWSELVADSHGSQQQPIALDNDEVVGANGVKYWINSPATVHQKAMYADSIGLAGVFLWEAGQDAVTDRESLLAAMAK
jgi:GH18 family chitinase